MADEDRDWGALGFAEDAAVFESASQNARVLSEGWVAANLFCPNCGAERLEAFPNNSKAADFGCAACREVYELKAKKGAHGRKVLDGAYGAMLTRLAEPDSPNLLLMSYDRARTRVTDLIAVPKWFLTPTVIEPKTPLGPTARRAGWQGCNILVGEIAATGKVGLIREGRQTPKPVVLAAWARTRFVAGRDVGARGWLTDVLRCVEEIGRPEFGIDDVYAFEGRLARLYPGNRNVRPKIRQQLQVLRDAGVLAFLPGERGRYRLIATPVKRRECRRARPGRGDPCGAALARRPRPGLRAEADRRGRDAGRPDWWRFDGLRRVELGAGGGSVSWGRRFSGLGRCAPATTPLRSGAAPLPRGAFGLRGRREKCAAVFSGQPPGRAASAARPGQALRGGRVEGGERSAAERRLADAAEHGGTVRRSEGRTGRGGPGPGCDAGSA